MVQLGKRIGDTKDLGKVFQDFGGNLEGKATLLDKTGQGVDAADDRLLELGGCGFDVLKVTNGEGNQLL